MVKRWINRRLSLFLAVGLAAGSLLAHATPASAQTAGRFRILIPTKLERVGDVKDKFGKDVSKELRKLVDDMNTHQSVKEKELKDQLKKYKINEDALNCVYSQQLARLAGYELVMCGSYSQVGDREYELQASFVSPEDQQTFTVPPITTGDAKAAARHVFDSFQDYLTVISQTTYCMEDLSNENWDGAMTRCSRALEIDPDNQTALYGKGFVLMKTDRLEESMETLKRVLELNPMHQDALMAAGFVAAQLKRMDESRDYFMQYLELNPGNAQVRLQIAIDAAAAGNHLTALEIAEAGLQESEEADLTLVEYAGYFASSAAASAADEAAAEGPSKDELYAKALGYFDQVLEAKGDSVTPQVLTQKVVALRELGRAAEAVEFGTHATQIQPDQAPVWNAYAIALHEAGRIDDALAALDKVIELSPEQTSVRALQGQWLLNAGQIERAKDVFKQAIAAGALDGNMAANQFLAVAVNDKYQKKQYQAMVPYLDAALQLATDEDVKSMANFFMGYALYFHAESVQNPGTAASARQALPLFQRALEHLQKGRGYAERNNINLAEIINAANTYVEIQEALIKRGI